MVLPYIKMNLTQVYMCFPSWTLIPPPSPYHPSGSSQCTSPKHPVSCIEPGLVTCFIYDIIHVSVPFSQIIPPSPAPTESKRLFYTSVSLLLSCIQGYCYHLTSVYSCHFFLISSASVRSMPFLSFIKPIFAWNVPLVSLLFLKRSLVFPKLLFSSISLHWSRREAFL